jgi:hypothetical protein
MSLQRSKSVQARKILEYCPVIGNERGLGVETLTTTKKAKTRTPEDFELNLVAEVQRGVRVRTNALQGRHKTTWSFWIPRAGDAIIVVRQLPRGVLTFKFEPNHIKRLCPRPFPPPRFRYVPSGRKRRDTYLIRVI